MIVLFALLVFLLMLVEAARARRNERAQRARGGVEPHGDVYPVMRIAYPASFLAIALEGMLRGAPSATALAVGGVLFAVGKLIKWWAIVSLGPRWTFRVLVVPGDPLVVTGPYRFLRHPNYVGVVGELAGAAVIAHALVTGPLALLVFGVLLAKRIAIEERALRRETGDNPVRAPIANARFPYSDR